MNEASTEEGLFAEPQTRAAAAPGAVARKNVRKRWLIVGGGVAAFAIAVSSLMSDNTPLPEDPAVAERVEHLVGIADALRTTFPRNANMGLIWLHRRNARFNDRTPLATMLEDGLLGVIAVRAHLDCAWDWDQSGSKA